MLDDIARLDGQGFADGRNIFCLFKRLDQGCFVQGLGLLDAVRYEINIRVTQGSEIGSRFLLIFFDVCIPEMFTHLLTSLIEGAHMPYRVTASARGDLPKSAGHPGGDAYKDRRSESDLLGLLHDGQGISVIPGPDEDIRLKLFRVPEHGAIVSATQGSTFERFSLKLTRFPFRRKPVLELGLHPL